MKNTCLFSVLSTFLLLAACNGDGALIIDSTSYTDQTEIPLTYACVGAGGDNLSPQYSWVELVDTHTASYALIMDDEVPPCGTGDGACKHWAVFNIPADVNELEEGFDALSIQGVTEGKNYTGGSGYAGPCPPNPHIYKTTVYALNDEMPNIPANTGLTRSQFEDVYADNIINKATITGNFTPPAQ